jgi:WD40 repeat protein
MLLYSMNPLNLLSGSPIVPIEILYYLHTCTSTLTPTQTQTQTRTFTLTCTRTLKRTHPQAEIVRVLTKEKESLILTGHTGYVQGVAWDPLGEMVVTQSADRTFKAHMVSQSRREEKKRKRREGEGVVMVMRGWC